MESECLPFTRIPHTSRLFADYLAYAPQVRKFYPRSPYIAEWAAEEAKLIEYPDDRRQQVADILDRQNRTFGASEKTFANIKKLRERAAAVVTGQQVGVFGGPLFAILKALTAVADSEKSGVPCVPIFWLATEDHDIAEVSKTWVPGEDGSLRTIEVLPSSAPDVPVGDVRFGAEITNAVEQLADLLGPSDVTDAIIEAYRSGNRMGDAFGKLFAKIFADFGVILIDAYDPELHRIAEPIYRTAAEQAAEITDLLLQRGKELESDGYHEQVKVTKPSTLLFEIIDGQRTVIHRVNNHFKAGAQQFTREELIGRIKDHPELFSANVLLRPVMQDYLLPTLAYVGGPAEVAYFAQGTLVHKQILGRQTPVLPRLSATIVDPKQQKLLKKYGLKLSDLFEGPEKLAVGIAKKVMPESLRSNLTAADQAIASAYARLYEDLQRLDPTLVRAAKRTEGKMHYQVEKLGSRAARAEIRRNEIITRHAQTLSTHLFPNKNLPERGIAGVYYLAKYGMDLLSTWYEAAKKDCPNHQVLYL